MKNRTYWIALAIVIIDMVMILFLVVRGVILSAEMDRKELHYDANDWFMMVNTKTGMIGIYDGIEPMRHIYVGGLEDMEPGVYSILVYSE